MIADCRAGKIDMIITKSISRFARNTLDCLNYVRELKDLGIGIIFEKENINTLDAKGEVLLTILSSLAQDESRSISENCTWGIRRRFETGKHKMSTKRFLGYDTDETEKLVINRTQEPIVIRLYQEFLDGEVRYNALKRANPAKADKLFALNEQEAMERYDYLNKLVTVYAAEKEDK